MSAAGLFRTGRIAAGAPVGLGLSAVLGNSPSAAPLAAEAAGYASGKYCRMNGNLESAGDFTRQLHREVCFLFIGAHRDLSAVRLGDFTGNE